MRVLEVAGRCIMFQSRVVEQPSKKSIQLLRVCYRPAAPQRTCSHSPAACTVTRDAVPALPGLHLLRNRCCQAAPDRAIFDTVQASGRRQNHHCQACQLDRWRHCDIQLQPRPLAANNSSAGRVQEPARVSGPPARTARPGPPGKGPCQAAMGAATQLLLPALILNLPVRQMRVPKT